MNISAINSVKFFNNLQNANQNYKTEIRSNFGLRMSQPLQKDTVSFGCRKSVSTVADFYAISIEKSNPNLKSVAYRFLDTVGAVVSNLAQKGTNIATMPRDMAEKFVLKSGQSAKSKVLRSGTLDLTDRVRTTVYVQDLYDLSTLYEFINEMALRGYRLAKTEEPAQKILAKGCKLTKSEIEKGIVKVDDVSIRLYDEKDTPLKNMHSELSFALDGMQKSGYEDIQLRFTNGKDKFETIMLFGPKYAEAKHIESEKVRKFTREFDTLSIMSDYKNNPKIQTNMERVKYYKNSILGLFYDCVTRPLYHHAKGIDYRNMAELNKKNPDFMQIDYNTFNRNFAALKENIRTCYNSLSQNDVQNMQQYQETMYSDLRKINQIRRGLEQSGEELGVLKIPSEVKEKSAAYKKSKKRISG